MMNKPCTGGIGPLGSHSRTRALSINRSKGLKKLGVSEDDVKLATHLLAQIPACPSDPNKAERIFGYASSRLAREKALRLLGTTEEEIDSEGAKTLGSLGVAGRRRSFSEAQRSRHRPDRLEAFSPSLPRASFVERHSFHAIKREVHRKSMATGRRRTTSIDTVTERRRTSSDMEMKVLRSQARISQIKMEAMWTRIEELENRLANTASQQCDHNGTTNPTVVEAECSQAEH